MSSTDSSPQPTQAPSPWSETDKRIGIAAASASHPGATAHQPLAPRSANARPSRSKKTNNTEEATKPAKQTQAPKHTQEPKDTPGKKRKLNDTTSDNKPAAKKTKAADTKKSAESLLDVSDVTLPEEESESGASKIPVYETCDSIRRQVRAILKKPGMSQAAFCRALGELDVISGGASPPPRQLARFSEKKGAMKGNMNVVFYPSYVLFEKMRVRDGKAKSKFREEMEEKHAPRGGVDTERSCDGPFIVKGRNRPYFDKWGVFQIDRREPR